MYQIFLDDLGFSDVNVIIAGKHTCPPSHSFGPYVRDYFLIHYILEGKGSFKNCHGEYRLCKNDGFLIYPDEVTYYEADSKEPWEYVWIGFRGNKSIELLENIGLTQKNPIFHSYSCFEVFKEIEKCNNIECDKQLHILSLLYRFFSMMTRKQNDSPKTYASKAVSYISSNISDKLRVADISALLGIDRKYFCQVFKDEYKISPQQYILNKRIEMAKSLLSDTNLSIKEISMSVGYSDQLSFSKIFKKHTGYSPYEYKQNNK